MISLLKKSRELFVVISFILFFYTSFIQQISSEYTKKKQIEQIKFFGGTKGEIVNERRKLIKELISVFQSSTGTYIEKRGAVDLLGELKAEDAVGLFSKNITWGYDGVIISPQMGAMYPLTTVLYKIGLPAIPKLVENVRTHPSGFKRPGPYTVWELSLFVIEDISPLCGKAHIEAALKKEKDPKAKKNLQEALKYLNKVLEKKK